MFFSKLNYGEKFPPQKKKITREKKEYKNKIKGRYQVSQLRTIISSVHTFPSRSSSGVPSEVGEKARIYVAPNGR